MSVGSISRAFQLLRAVPDTDGTLSALATQTGIPIGTVSRLMGTLEQQGAVLRSEKAYRIGPAVTALAAAEPAAYDLGSLATQHLGELASQTNETAGMAQSVETDLLHLSQIATEHDVAVRDWTGVRVPAHSGAIGVVMMAYWPEEQLDAYLESELDVFSQCTVTDSAAIRQRLATVRSVGWLWTTDEYATGVTTVAAPIRDRTGTAAGALHVHGPSFRFPSPDTAQSRRRIGSLVQERADAVSGVLGWKQGR